MTDYRQELLFILQKDGQNVGNFYFIQRKGDVERTERQLIVLLHCPSCRCPYHCVIVITGCHNTH